MPKVTVTQMDSDSGTDAFESQWQALIDHVTEEGSSIVLLPEMPFCEWFAHESTFSQATWDTSEAQFDKWRGRLAEIPADSVLFTLPRTTPEGGRRQSAYVYDRATDSLGCVHDKGYLPNEPPVFEARWYEHGDRSKFDTFPLSHSSKEIAKAGFMICTEVWWPEHSRQYGVHNGASLIFSPRATDPSGFSKWLGCGVTNAVIAGAFELSSNRFSERHDLDFGGQGWVIDPNGKVLAVTSKEVPYVTVDIDLAEADAAKLTYPRYCG